MIQNLQETLNLKQKENIRKYKKKVKKNNPFKMWKQSVDLYVTKFPTIIQVMHISFDEDPIHPILNKIWNQHQLQIKFYVILLYLITFGIPVMMIIVFLFSPKCDPEWKCPDHYNFRCAHCVEICPYHRYGIFNKICGFLLFLVLVYQQKVEKENDKMGNYTIMRSVVYNVNVEVYNEMYVALMQFFLYVSTYILFVTNSDYIELLLNCLALTFYSTVDDILGAYFCGRILLPYKMRELLINSLNKGKQHEKNNEWRQAIHHYTSLYKYCKLPCQIYHETPHKTILYIDPNQIIERIKQCDMKLKGQDIVLEPLEIVKITDEIDLKYSHHAFTLYDYQHMLRYSDFRDENEARKLMQQDKFYGFNNFLRYIDKIAILAFCILIPFCI